MNERPHEETVLILALGGIGDVLMTIPVMRALKDQNRPYAVCLNNRLASALFELEPQLAPQAGLHFARTWRSLWHVCRSGYDACYMNHVVPLSGFRYSFLPWAARIPALYGERIGDWKKRPFIRNGVQVADRFLVHRSDLNVRCFPDWETLRRDYRLDALCALPKQPGRIGIHPGSDNASVRATAKRWPVTAFLEVCDRLCAKGISRSNIRVFIGPSEMELRAPFVEQGIPVVSGRSFPDVAREIAACSYFLANDSGIAHLAYSAGLTPVVLFGWSEPQHTGPKRCVPVKASDSVQDISVDKVYEAITNCFLEDPA